MVGRAPSPASPRPPGAAARLRPVPVAALAAVDVGVGWLRTLPRLAESDVAGVAASVLVGRATALGLAPGAAALPLYGYLVYALAPRVFPRRVRHVAGRRGFRALAAGATLVVPAALVAPGALAPLVACALLLPAYVLAVQGRASLGPDGFAVAFADAFVPEVDVRAGVADARPRALLASFAFLALAVTAVLFVVLGLLLSLLYLASPVPEVLLAGWAVYRVVGGPRAGPVQFDLEARLVALAGAATDGFKGFGGVALATAGVFLPMLVLAIGGQLLAGLPAVAAALVGSTPTARLGIAVAAVTLLAYGAYGVWYWLRILARVPHLLDAWLDRSPRDVATPPGRDPGPLLARPPGLLLPPTAMLVAVALMSADGGLAGRSRLPWALLAAWAGALVATAWSAYRGATGDPQPPVTDNVALPASALVQVLGFWPVLSEPARRLLLGRGPAGPVLAELSGAAPVRHALALVTVALALFYLDDVEDAWTHGAGPRRLVVVPFVLAVVGAVGGLLAGAAGPARWLLGLGIAALAAVLVAALAHDLRGRR